MLSTEVCVVSSPFCPDYPVTMVTRLFVAVFSVLFSGYLVSMVTLLFVAVFEIWWQTFSPSVSYAVNLMAVSIVAVGCTG